MSVGRRWTDARDHFVYRAYDKSDRLLYVGVSKAVRRRMGQHKKRSDWHRSMHRLVLRGPYAQIDAEEVERDLIRALDPIYNKRRYGAGTEHRPSKRRPMVDPPRVSLSILRAASGMTREQICSRVNELDPDIRMTATVLELIEGGGCTAERYVLSALEKAYGLPDGDIATYSVRHRRKVA